MHKETVAMQLQCSYRQHSSTVASVATGWKVLTPLQSPTGVRHRTLPETLRYPIQGTQISTAQGSCFLLHYIKMKNKCTFIFKTWTLTSAKYMCTVLLCYHYWLNNYFFYPDKAYFCPLSRGTTQLNVLHKSIPRCPWPCVLIRLVYVTSTQPACGCCYRSSLNTTCCLRSHTGTAANWRQTHRIMHKCLGWGLPQRKRSISASVQTGRKVTTTSCDNTCLNAHESSFEKKAAGRTNEICQINI